MLKFFISISHEAFASWIFSLQYCNNTWVYITLIIKLIYIGTLTLRSSLFRSLIIQWIRSIVEKSSIGIDKLSKVVVLYRPIVVYIKESTNVLDSLFNNCLINDEYTLNTFLPRDISIGLLDLSRGRKC